MKITELKTNNCSVDEICEKCNIQFTPDSIAFFSDSKPVCYDCGLSNPISINKETLNVLHESFDKAFQTR